MAKVGSTTVASTTNGNDLTIPLGTISTDTLLRIYDDQTNSTTAPSLSVGKVTINGSIASGSGATLQVLVANSSVTAFPGNGQVQSIVLPGVVNLGRSTDTAPGGLVIPDTDLRNATVLALAATGDLAGDIDVGRVFRIQALGRVENNQFLGGVIASNVTAHTPDVFAPLPDGALSDYAINVITCGDLISGNIVATGVYDDLLSNSRRGTIGRIVVGPSESARGITGNIEARSSDISIGGWPRSGVTACHRSLI